MQRWRAVRSAVEPPLRGSTRLAHALKRHPSSNRHTAAFTQSTTSSSQQRLLMLRAPLLASALRPSRVLYVPFIPTVVRSAEVAAAMQEARNRNERGAISTTLIHELSVLPIDEFVQRVHRFSRTNFAASQRPLLYAHLKEAMKPQRIAQMNIKALYDFLHLAHVAGLHETCLELYHAAREHMPPSTLALRSKGAAKMARESLSYSSSSSGSDAGATLHAASAAAATTTNRGSSGNLVAESAVLVSNYVVDSAYAMQGSAELTRLASYCVSQLIAPVTASSTAAATSAGEAGGDSAVWSAVRTPQETVTGISLVRCLWRALCLVEYHRCTEARGSGAEKGGSATQAWADAAAILEGCHRVAAAARRAETGTTTATADPHQQQPKLADQLREAIHFVRYASVADDGEFAFFHFCKERNILVAPQPLPGADESTSNGAAAAAAAGPLPVRYNSDEVQVFYGSLIETCTAGQLVPEAMQYFTEARRLLGCPSLGDEEDNSAEVLMATAAATMAAPRTEFSSPTHTAAPPLTSAAGEAPVAPPPPPPPPPLAPHTTTVAAAAGTGPADGAVFTDFLIHRLLFALQAAKDNRRTVRLARALIATGATAGIRANLWSLVLISAGAVRAADVALAAHDEAVRQLGTLGGGEASGAEQRTWSYVLQTSLSALSKCQLPHYEQDYLQPAQEKGMVQCTAEFYYGCLLQDAHNSTNPVPRAAEILTRMGEAGVPLTAPLVTRLLKLYLRVEAAEFLEVYRHAADQLHLRRSLWTDQLLLWADRRRYFLTAEDRAYIVEEVLRARNATDAARVLPMLGGMRAQFALLAYDQTHAARERFLRDGTLPADAPTMQDSRAHFLTSRALSVQRGMEAAAGESWVCADGSYDAATGEGEEEVGVGGDAAAATRAQFGVLPHMIGDPHRRALHATIAELSEVPLMLPAGGGGGVALEEERLHDEALRVYLADALEGLQRSLNSVS